MSRIKENTMLLPEYHVKVVEQAKKQNRSKSSVIEEAVIKYFDGKKK